MEGANKPPELPSPLQSPKESHSCLTPPQSTSALFRFPRATQDPLVKVVVRDKGFFYPKCILSIREKKKKHKTHPLGAAPPLPHLNIYLDPTLIWHCSLPVFTVLAPASVNQIQ